MSLSDIVQVTITAQTTAPTRTGFGVPLVMAFHSVFTERARVYSSVDAMLDDGFTATDEAVLAVQALFAQNPRPVQAVVGREVNRQKKMINLTLPSVLRASYDYTVYVNGKEATYTSDATPTVAEITAGLKAAIDALSEAVTTTDNATDLDIEANTIAVPFTFYVKDPADIYQENVTPDGSPDGIVADIAAVREENDSWYGLILTNASKPCVLAAAAYIEANIKIMVTQSADTGMLSASVTDDVASELQTAGYARTAILYHPKEHQHAGAAWLGKCLPKDPGSITWKFKTLAGVDTVALTDTEVTALEGKDANHYTTIAGVAITQQGVTSAGEFIDITQSVDFMRARLQEYIYTRLANADKIPFTDPGIAIVEAEVRAVMVLCVNQGILAADPAPTVSVPRAADVSMIDKAARLLPDVKFEATLAGAIHKVIVNGTVSV